MLFFYQRGGFFRVNEMYVHSCGGSAEVEGEPRSEGWRKAAQLPVFTEILACLHNISIILVSPVAACTCRFMHSPERNLFNDTRVLKK